MRYDVDDMKTDFFISIFSFTTKREGMNNAFLLYCFFESVSDDHGKRILDLRNLKIAF